MLRADTQTCFYCGYEQDEHNEKLIRAKKAVHDFLERNPQSDGSDKNYRIRRKWKSGVVSAGK